MHKQYTYHIFSGGNDQPLNKAITKRLLSLVLLVVMLVGCALPVTGIGGGQTERWAKVPTIVLLAQSEQGNGILGVIDGSAPLGIELDTDITHRKKFLRDIGYKR